MLKLSEKIGRRMRRKNAFGNIIHYFHSDRQYHGFHKQHKVGEWLNDGRDIYQAAWGIFRSSLRWPSTRLRNGQAGSDNNYPLSEVEGLPKIKIMGVAVSGLK